MNALERFKAYEHKTFGNAAALYVKEFEGKCKRRQEYALNPVLTYIEDIPLLDMCDSALVEHILSHGCLDHSWARKKLIDMCYATITRDTVKR